MRLSKAAAAFLRYCSEERHVSPNTICAYRQDLAEFQSYIGGSRIVRTLGASDVLNYRNALTSIRNLAPATIKRRVACIRTMFAWLVRRGVLETSPFAKTDLRIHVPARLPRCLDPRDLRCLLRHRRRCGPDIALAVALLLATGMRVGELAALRIDDIDADTGRLRILGKGSRERTVFVINSQLRSELQKYLSVRHAGANVHGASLLADDRGRALTTARIRFLIAHVARASGIRRHVTPHMLRHTAATMLLESGTDVRFVQRLLGHRSIVTTQIYTHVSDRALQKALARADVFRAYAGSKSGRSHDN